MSETSSEPHSEKEDSADDKFTTKNILLVFGGILALGIAIGFVPWIVFSSWPEANSSFPSNAGTWGDSFGFVNAIMSSLGLAGILITLWMQRTELRLQREEMRLTRREFSETREEHKRMADSQELSANRQLLATYMDALESLRQMSQWRMSNDPAWTEDASFPVVEGLVNQMRVNQALEVLVHDLEHQVRDIHDRLTLVGNKGSRLQRLELLLVSCAALRHIADSYNIRTDDIAVFQGLANQAEGNYEIIQQCSSNMNAEWQDRIDHWLATQAPWLGDDKQILEEGKVGREKRARYIQKLSDSCRKLLEIIQSFCRE